MTCTFKFLRMSLLRYQQETNWKLEEVLEVITSGRAKQRLTKWILNYQEHANHQKKTNSWYICHELGDVGEDSLQP